MASNRNFGHPRWPAGSVSSHLTDTESDKEVLQSSFTTPYHSVPNFDWQIPGGEPWPDQELEQNLSWLNSVWEDHQRNADSRSQFPMELNENSHVASSEAWKKFLLVGDGDVETAPGPENLGIQRSRATQGTSPKRNHTSSVVETAQNLNYRRSQKKIEGLKKTGRRQRGPNWSLEENQSFLHHMELQKSKAPWEAVSDSLKAMGFFREAKACEDHWGVLLANLKKFENHFGSDNILRDLHLWPSVGAMSREHRSQKGLPLLFEVEWFEAISRIVKERSRKHRKTRSLECSNGRIIHVGGTPSCSCRQQPRVCAASAAPSSEIFDNPVGDSDGMSELVKLLDCTDRNVTVDQTIEVMKIRLEAQKMDLRSKEIEWERERSRMYQGQRNGQFPEKARHPAAHEWN